MILRPPPLLTRRIPEMGRSQTATRRTAASLAGYAAGWTVFMLGMAWTSALVIDVALIVWAASFYLWVYPDGRPRLRKR